LIAEVIVDVAAHQTDRVFEYHIPDDLEVEIGSRVVVPFGRRKGQGFVVAVKKKQRLYWPVKGPALSGR
jgi:primosomal protein N' (replication factor Y) (superfamily II helicase)